MLVERSLAFYNQVANRRICPITRGRIKEFGLGPTRVADRLKNPPESDQAGAASAQRLSIRFALCRRQRTVRYP
jgi:hypothetical protein